MNAKVQITTGQSFSSDEDMFNENTEQPGRIETVRDEDPIELYDDDLEESLIGGENQGQKNIIDQRLIGGFDKKNIDREKAIPCEEG